MRNLALHLLPILSAIIISVDLRAQPGECLGGGCLAWMSTSGLAAATTSSSFQPSSIRCPLGHGIAFPVTAGSTYEWSLCPEDGAVLPSNAADVSLTLRRSDQTPLCFSSDVCGIYPKIRWTADQTTEVNLFVHIPSCNQTASSDKWYRPAWRCVSCPGFTPCTSRADIQCGTTYTGVHDNGTGQYDLTGACGGAPGRERVYSFIPGNSGPMDLVQFASHTAVKWYFKEASLGCGTTNWTCIGTLSGAGTSNPFFVTAHTRYLLLADPVSTVEGSVQFRLQCTPPPDPCASPTPIYCANSYNTVIPPGSGNMTDPAGVAPDGREHVYSLTTSLGGTYVLSVSSTTAPIAFSLSDYINEPCDFLWRGNLSGPGTIELYLQAFRTYTVRVDALNTGGATFSFSVDCSQLHNPCSTITDLICDTPVSISTAGAGAWASELPSCGSRPAGKEYLFSFTPTSSGPHSIQHLSFPGQSVHYYYKPQSADCSINDWECIGVFFGPGNSPSFPMQPGVPYYILADVQSSVAVNYSFKLTCPPPYDPCPGISTAACGMPVTTVIAAGNGAFNPVQNTCGFGTPGQERIVRFTAPYSGTYNIRQLAAYGWTDYFVKPESGGCAGTGWTCIDDLFGAELSAPFTLLQGTTYLIMADPETISGGTLTFQIECSSPYDACALIEPLAGCNVTMTVQIGSGNGSFLNPSTSCGANTPGRERIFTYTATQSGRRFFQQFTSYGTINYYVKPQSGGCNASGWTCLGGISGAGVTSTYNMSAGTTYLVMLDPQATTGGTVSFVLGCASTGNVCTSSMVGLLYCGTDMALNIPVGAGGFLTQAGCSGGPMPGLERIFTFTPTVSGPHTVVQIVDDITNYATYRYSYRENGFGACPSGWTCIGYRQGTDQVGTVNLTAGITYLLMVDVSTIYGGQVTVRIECPNYNACTSITPIHCGTSKYTVLGQGLGSMFENNCDETEIYNNLFGKERIFRFRPLLSGYHTITQTGSGGTFHYSVYNNSPLQTGTLTCNTNTVFVCWDILTGPYEEAEPLWLEADFEYLIMVDRFDTLFSSVTFTIHCPVPENDLCANATPLYVSPWDTSCPVGATPGNNAGACTQDGPTPSCDTYAVANDGPWPDVWFTFESGPTAVVAEVYLGSVGDLSLELFLDDGTGCPGSSVWCQAGVSGTLYLPVQPYSIYRLRAFTNLGYSVPGSFSICLHRPPPPPCASTISPTPFETIEEGSPVHLEWASSPGAISYRIDLYDVTAYAPDTVDGFPITTYGTELVLNALPVADYSWRVTPLSLYGTGDYCPYTYFSIIPPATTSLQVPARALLDGAWVPATGLMRDNLRTAALIPAQHPYGGAPWFHDGGEELEPFALQTTGPNAVVDWVLLELRAQGAPSQVVARRAGLVQRDGDIVDTDGVSPITFLAVPIGNYHVAVRHRNHLGAMTLDAIFIDGLQATIDLTSPALPTYGTQARKQLSGGSSPLGLWAGDVNADGMLKYVGNGNDRDPMLVAIGGTVPTNTITGYRMEDISLDGQVKYVGEGNDRDPVLQNVGGAVPTAVRTGTLP